MKRFGSLCLALSCTLVGTFASAAEPSAKKAKPRPAAPLPAEAAAPLGEKDKLIFSDDFDRETLGPAWKVGIPAFAIKEGVLQGLQERDDHGSSAGATLPLPDGNAILEVKVRFAGAKSFNVNLDDKDFKGTHAGHIARLVVRPAALTLMDDREGVMRNDIYELRKSEDAAKKAEGTKLAAGTTATVPFEFEQEKWYLLGLEVVGERMRVTLDGKAVGWLHSKGLAHPTKPHLRLGVWGKGEEAAHFDELRIWSVKATPKS